MKGTLTNPGALNNISRRILNYLQAVYRYGLDLYKNFLTDIQAQQVVRLSGDTRQQNIGIDIKPQQYM